MIKKSPRILRETGRPVRRNTKVVSRIFMGLFYAGLIGIVLALGIYRKTIIDWKIPVFLWLGTGLAITFCFRNHIQKYLGVKNILLQFFASLCSFGGLVTFTFMAVNYYCSFAQPEEIKAGVTGAGYENRKGGCSTYVYVDIKGTKKELSFPCDFKFQGCQFIILNVRRGLLGFDRILSQNPVYRAGQ
jgi:hypothetical protein